MGDSSPHDDLSQYSVEHRARMLRDRSASAEAPPPKQRVVRELVLIGITIVVTLLLWPYREVATADYPEAQALADRLLATYEPVWRGDISPDDLSVPDGLRLFEFPIEERTVSVLTHTQPTAENTCYALRTGGGFITTAVRFAPTEGCVAQGPWAFESSGTWNEVLPNARETPLWFVPAVGLLAFGALSGASSIAMKRMFR